MLIYWKDERKGRKTQIPEKQKNIQFRIESKKLPKTGRRTFDTKMNPRKYKLLEGSNLHSRMRNLRIKFGFRSAAGTAKISAGTVKIG